MCDLYCLFIRACQLIHIFVAISSINPLKVPDWQKYYYIDSGFLHGILNMYKSGVRFAQVYGFTTLPDTGYV